MEKSFKNKNLLVIIFEILVIVLAVIGITYATQKLFNNSSLTMITTGEYNVDYVGESNIVAQNLEPISDNLINYNTSDNVIRVEFSLRGVKENDNDELIYDVMLTDMNIDCSLLNKYTKWNLYKNGKLISNGSLDPLFDGNVINDNMRLTNIQEDLPEYNEEYDKYVLIFWISESCDDLKTCTLVDQSSIVDSKMSMKVFIGLYSGKKKANERIPSYNTTCSNKPVLSDNMIPVTYKDGEWVVANENNSDKDNLWYDYGNQKWANAVVVADSSKYSNVGEKVNNNDILANLVWIPRFRYKLWNASDKVTDSYKAYDNGIDIIFENGVSSSSNNKIENNLYITHPAFGDNLKGFWISKYEISKNDNGYKSINNIESYRGETLDNYKNIMTNISTDYKLGEKVESHIVTNLEWGATLYLSHSKYGVCSGDGCDSISLNNSYISGNNKQDTTTRNVYGVYDMAGASMEYTVGNMDIGTATSEVMLDNSGAWYGSIGLLSNKGYNLRGGMEHGIFYFGDEGMDYVEKSARFSLISK